MNFIVDLIGSNASGMYNGQKHRWTIANEIILKQPEDGIDVREHSSWDQYKQTTREIPKSVRSINGMSICSDSDFRGGRCKFKANIYHKKINT